MWAALGLTLVLGVGLGVVLDRVVLDAPRHESHARDLRERDQQLLERLVRELGLTPEQRGRLDRVLDANRGRAHAFWKQTRGSYAELRAEFRRDIRGLLDPKQQRLFDQIAAREDREREEREGRERTRHP
jgi:uncharacterized membrane-anchored protein YhcB (DUF1043 family)